MGNEAYISLKKRVTVLLSVYGYIHERVPHLFIEASTYAFEKPTHIYLHSSMCCCPFSNSLDSKKS